MQMYIEPNLISTYEWRQHFILFYFNFSFLLKLIYKTSYIFFLNSLILFIFLIFDAVTTQFPYHREYFILFYFK